MSPQLDRLESKLDKTIEAVADISVNVGKLEVHIERNSESLDEHMRRTELSEIRLERLEKVEQWIRGAVWVILGLIGLSIALLKLLAAIK